MAEITSNPELSSVLDRLRCSTDGIDDETLRLTRRALQLLVPVAESVFAFVRGKNARSVEQEWGDNGRSFWAHLYELADRAPRADFLLVLKADDAICELIGIFPSADAALAVLGQRGKVARL